MGRVTGMLAALALCAGAAACAAGPRAGGSGDGDPDVAGVIAAVEPGQAQTRVTVDVAGASGDAARAVLLVSPATVLEVRRPDGTTAAGTASALTLGARVEAWHDGVAMRSLPPQYRATRIRVVTR